MTDALIEKVARVIREAQQPWGDDYTPEARAAILAVLDHFSDPSNVSDKFIDTMLKHPPQWGWKPSIAAAMRAARDEVSRDDARHTSGRE